jgi:hypothetical protein
VNVERWDTCELALTSAQVYANPFRDVDLQCAFTHQSSEKTIVVHGFYDGGTTWRIRFMPTELGVWRYVTESADAALDRHQGQLICVEPTASYLHGPLSTRGFAFFHADGMPRFLVSTRLSCHLQPPEIWEDAIAYLQAHQINRVLFMMGGAHGTIKCLYGEGADGPDFWRYDVSRFQAIDRFVDALRRADLLASPYFYYFNDGTQRKMTLEQDRAYLRYGMARFGAYANVLPVLSNEVEQKYTTRRGQYDLASHTWANEMGTYLKGLAVFGLPVTVHDPMETDNAVNPGFYTLLQDWPFPWTDYMLRQAQIAALSTAPELRDDIPEQKAPVYNLRGYARHNLLLIDLRRFGQPVINEEPGYEMEGRTAFPDSTEVNLRPWNSQSPDTLVPTFWTAAMAGGYVMWGNYATYWFRDPLPGIQQSETPCRLKILHDFMTSLPYWETEPANDLVSAGEESIEGRSYRTNFCLAIPGQVYVVFSLLGGKIAVKLAEGTAYQVTQLDPRTGEQVDLGLVGGGVQSISVAGQEQAIVLKAI